MSPFSLDHPCALLQESALKFVVALLFGPSGSDWAIEGARRLLSGLPHCTLEQMDMVLTHLSVRLLVLRLLTFVLSLLNCVSFGGHCSSCMVTLHACYIRPDSAIRAA